MAGRRYTTDNYTLYDNEYTVELYDADLIGDTINVWKLATPGLILKKDKASEGVYGGIKRSHATITWRVETESEQLLLEGMAQHQENKFFIKISINGNLEFYGPMLTDGLNIQNSGLPYDAQLTFSDGLSYLKATKEELTYTTAFNLIMQMLRQTDLAALKADSDPFCSTAIRWFEEEMPYSTTFNPFSNWKIGGQFNVIKDLRKNEWYTHYEILERFLLTFGAWLEMSGGRFRIINLSSASQENMIWHTYARDGSVLVNGVSALNRVTEGDEQIARVDDGTRYGYQPQLKRIERTYNYDGWDLLFNRSNYDPTSLFYVANITKPSGATFIKINGMFAINAQSNSPSASYTFRTKYVVKIQIIDGGTTHYYNGVSWVTSSASFTYYGPERTFFQAQPIFFNETVSLVSAAIPTPGGVSVEIAVSMVDLVGFFHNWVYVHSFQCQWLQILHQPPENTDVRKTIYSVKNLASKSSKVDVIKDAFLGDGPSPVSNTRITINTGSGVYKDSERWRIENSGTYTKIIGLQMQENMRHFSLPRRRYNMRFSGFLESYKTLSYDGKILMFSTYNYDADADQNVCEMIEVARVATDYDEEVVDIVNGVVLDTFGVSELPTGTGSIGVPIDATDGVASGTVSSITVVPIDVDGPIQGQKITILNPTNGQSHEVELSADWDASDTTISIVEITLANIYPVGSLLLMPSEEASNAINRRSSGYIAGLKVGATAIGQGSDKILIDTANGNMTLEGSDIRLNGLPDESEASTGQLCVTSEGVVKVKS